MRKKIRSLSTSSQSKNLYEFLEVVKNHVSDIRNEIPCKPEIERDVRIATCDAIEEHWRCPGRDRRFVWSVDPGQYAAVQSPGDDRGTDARYSRRTTSGRRTIAADR